jgi:hypothetical protein
VKYSLQWSQEAFYEAFYLLGPGSSPPEFVAIWSHFRSFVLSFAADRISNIVGVIWINPQRLVNAVNAMSWNGVSSGRVG